MTDGEKVIYVTLELDEFYHFSKVILDPALANAGTCEGVPVYERYEHLY